MSRTYLTSRGFQKKGGGKYLKILGRRNKTSKLEDERRESSLTLLPSLFEVRTIVRSTHLQQS